jgi:hypothetical protein
MDYNDIYESELNDAIYLSLQHNSSNNSQNSRISGGNSGGDGPNILYQSLYDTNPVKKVASDKFIQSLKPIRFNKIKNHSEEHMICPITQREFKEKSKVIQLPCSHCFSPKAILKWLSEENFYCPVCRFEFESTEKIIKTEKEEIIPRSSNRRRHVVDNSQQQQTQSITIIPENNLDSDNDLMQFSQLFDEFSSNTFILEYYMRR